MSQTFTQFKILCCCVFFSGKLCFYFNPTIDLIHVVEETAEELFALDLSKPTLVCGDFNARIDVQNDEKAEFLVDLLEDLGFLLLNNVDDITYRCYNGESTIDLAFSNFPGCTAETEKSNKILLLRKHIPVLISCPLPQPIMKIESKKKRKRLVEEIDSSKVDLIKAKFDSLDLDDGYKQLCSCILDSAPLVSSATSSKKTGLKLSQEAVSLKCDLIKLHKRKRFTPQLLQDYATKKQQYKQMIIQAKQYKIQQEELHRLAEAESFPWKLNPRRNGWVSSKIPLDEWEPHFSMLYNPPPETLPLPDSDHDYQVPQLQQYDSDWFEDDEETLDLNREFTLEELSNTLKTLSDKKAVGTDEIANEHLKGSFSVMGQLWLLLFNIVLQTGLMISSWRNSIVKVLYKGKGNSQDPNSYRGIALLSHVYKWFTKLLSRRIYQFVEGSFSLPEEQFGFRRGKSTLETISHFRRHVKQALSRPRNPLFAVFVDFKKAFDFVPRNLLICKLYRLHNIRGKILRVLVTLLEYNMIKVFDGISFSEDIIQLRGVQQGDSLSPLLFILFVSDLPGFLNDVSDILHTLMFADDLVFFSTNKDDIQQALNQLSIYCRQNRLEVNLSKTKVLKFRRGGGSSDDVFYYNGRVVEHCNSYEYLGLTLQTTWTFTKHLKKVRMKAAAATFRIKNLQKLSLEGAKKFFRIMIEPIITYGLKVIWKDLNICHLRMIDSCQCDFYKKVLGLPKNTRNRKVILMAGLRLLTENLADLYGRTPTFENYVLELENKFADVEEEFFKSPVMAQDAWKRGNYDKRHLVCRVSSHGFHYKICIFGKCMDRDNSCLCKFCFERAGSLLHVLDCSVLKTKELSYFDTL